MRRVEICFQHASRVAFLLAFVVAAILTPGSVDARKFYCSPRGSDATGTGTAANPYYSLAKPFNTSPGLQPGDTVFVKSGFYGDFNSSQTEWWPGASDYPARGTKARPIVVMGDFADRPELHNIRVKFTCFTVGKEPAHIQFKNINFRMHPNSTMIGYTLGFFSENRNRLPEGMARDITVDSVTFKQIQWVALKFSGVDSFTARHVVADSFAQVVSGCAASTNIHAGLGIDMVGCHHGIIEDCYIDNCGDRNGGACNNYSGVGIMMKGGCNYMTVRRNLIKRVYNAVSAGEDGGCEFHNPPVDELDQDGELGNYEAKRIYIYSNVLELCTLPLYISNSKYVYFINNTTYDPRPYQDGLNYGSQYVVKVKPFVRYETYCRDNANNTIPNQEDIKATNCYINNNIFAFATVQIYSGSQQQNYIVFQPTSDDQTCWYDASTFDFGNNLWFRTDDTTKSLPDFNNLAGLCGQLPSHAGSHKGDPMFVNPTPSLPGDFKLSGSSPALAAGRYIPEIMSDFRGFKFKDIDSGGATKRSMGAFEDYPDGPTAPPMPPVIMIRPK